MNKSRRRITGWFEHGPRGVGILTDVEDLWVLEVEDFDTKLLGNLVTAEGVLVGFDRLKVDWIGDANV